MNEWDCFLEPADEWFVNYSAVPSLLKTVVLFSVGHAVELYLKAANAKITGDIDRAVRFSHRIADLMKDCREQDANFMPDHTLLESVLASDFLSHRR